MDGAAPFRVKYVGGSRKFVLKIDDDWDRFVAGVEREVIERQTRKNAPSGIVSAGRQSIEFERAITIPATEAAHQWEGWGTALKPACEPIVLARKPLSEGTVAANVLKWGTGAINVDGCRVATDDGYQDNAVTQGINTAQTSYAPAVVRRTFEPAKNGRWPANVIHDGSEEVLAAFPDSSAEGHFPGNGGTHDPSSWSIGDERSPPRMMGDSGSAARFFYASKADSDDRLGSKHPTVKPVDLMQYLVRLVTPKGGSVLDPFAGTGTTGEAAWREGMRAVLIEREAEYQADIRRRMELVKSGPNERAAKIAANSKQAIDPGPLFGGAW